jgi:hypothetical protein
MNQQELFDRLTAVRNNLDIDTNSEYTCESWLDRAILIEGYISGVMLSEIQKEFDGDIFLAREGLVITE